MSHKAKSNNRGGRFRNWGFNTQTVNDEVPKFIESQCHSKGWNYIFQLERGEESGSLHYQVGIIHTEPIRFSTIQNVFKDIQPRYIKKYTKKGTLHYCSKRETRVKGPWTNIKKLKFLPTLDDPLEGNKLFDWQEELVEILKGKPDKRKVYWYYDSIGNTGKSSFIKWYCMKHEDATLIGRTLKDTVFVIGDRMDNSIDTKVIFYDIPRNAGNRMNYELIEQLKIGHVFSGKYESRTLMFNCPHIVIFSNYPPDKDGLSLDRWVIKDISVR